jgi:hypothetical protein
MKRNKLAESITIKQMAEILSYAIQWADTDDEPSGLNSCYHSGCIETASHIVACWLCQARLVEGWNEGVGTAEVRDALGLDLLKEFHHPPSFWEKQLKALIKRWNKDTP